VLVFEDDAELATGYLRTFESAMREADALDPGYLIYLGCGDNKYLPDQAKSPSLLVPGGPLPATDAIVFDRAAAERRLGWIAQHPISRPADWLMRETDAAVGVRHYWLREPIVRQGSMSGRFVSVLDHKRRFRGRWYSWLRYRWDRWRRWVLRMGA
jgi:glycosyl transferase family 25